MIVVILVIISESIFFTINYSLYTVIRGGGGESKSTECHRVILILYYCFFSLQFQCWLLDHEATVLTLLLLLYLASIIVTVLIILICVKH